MEVCGVKLKMSSSRHPQTNGSSEILNRMIENYLRCYCPHRQENWSQLPPAVDLAYNSARCEDIGMSPFEKDLSWYRKNFLELLLDYSSTSTVQKSQKLKQLMDKGIQDAKLLYGVAKAGQSANLSIKSEPNKQQNRIHTIRQEALFKDTYSKSPPSAKLSAKPAGPFVITKIMGKPQQDWNYRRTSKFILSYI